MSRDAKRNGIKKALLEALRLNYGNVTKACEAVGITRKYFYQYAKDDPEFKETIEEIQESSIDVVEGELFKQIKNGSTTATIFFLKTRGQKRGYIERQQIDVTQHSPDLSHLSTDDIRDLLGNE